MRTETIKCDKCGKEQAGKYYWFRIEIDEFETEESQITQMAENEKDVYASMDLCEECCEAIKQEKVCDVIARHQD